MPKYSATYRRPFTGASYVRIAAANNWREAFAQLPRWTYPDGKAYRRDGTPRKLSK